VWVVLHVVGPPGGAGACQRQKQQPGGAQHTVRGPKGGVACLAVLASAQESAGAEHLSRSLPLAAWLIGADEARGAARRRGAPQLLSTSTEHLAHQRLQTSQSYTTVQESLTK
jgi:hypothetical protein